MKMVVVKNLILEIAEVHYDMYKEIVIYSLYYLIVTGFNIEYPSILYYKPFQLV